jgi:release factor glutamine methyltransferase
VSWADLLRQATAQLNAALGGDRRQEVRWMVERVSGYSATDLRRNETELIGTRSVAWFDAMLTRRCAGEPLQYVLGRWGFRSLDLMVNADVLIPRPETEYVAEYAINAAKAVAKTRAPVVVDLGTGSGAIALSVAAEVATSRVWATDVSPRALAVARANLAGLGRPASRVTLAEGSWFAALPSELVGAIDVLVSNPPYVDEAQPLPSDVRDYEPREALFADDQGFADVRILITEAPLWVRPGGCLVVEMGETQTDQAMQLALSCGFVNVTTIVDLAGKPRGIVAYRPT